MAVKKRQKTLSHGRPPASRPKERMTSERSRTIIRTHHHLQKEHAAALKRGDSKLAEDLSLAIEKNGGIKLYQAASKQGQAKDRGGDSSKILVDWLQQSQLLHSNARSRKSTEMAPLKCLEVGALSTTNEISKFPNIIDMTRIDLNSQGSGIEKQDFMERPLPMTDGERFDIMSLSLVLNYVPDACGRGEMLKRVAGFLRPRTSTVLPDGLTTVFPALFLVLPLPCIENSRYFDEDALLQIMVNLGFTVRYSKVTSKLCYYLFTLTGSPTPTKVQKKKIRDGPTMNNFCIIVE
ncbi:putative methyltransferase-domain-containing protein [Pyrenochaeta sp. MPI-SDFR-AT-0127]|nr:putative methyltransferase-domain-containing protein [Pyrenochaeta sp. MPI-SDFR-AT-0127]